MFYEFNIRINSLIIKSIKSTLTKMWLLAVFFRFIIKKLQLYLLIYRKTLMFARKFLPLPAK